MKKSVKKISIALSVLLLSACAAERGVEKVPYPNGAPLDKSLLIGKKKDSKVFKLKNLDTAKKFWFGKVTVVKNSGNTGFNFIGLQSDMKMGYFEFTENQLEFRNAVTPYKNRKTKDELITAWSVKHVDLRLGESNGKVSNKEVEDTYKKWEAKNYFQPEWSGAINGESSFMPSMESSSLKSCYQKKSANLVDGSEELTENSLNFTVAVEYQLNPYRCGDIRRGNRMDFTYTAHYKYSFRAVTSEDLTGYTPYVYDGENDPLQKKYGYFQTVVETLDENGRIQNKILMNRWHPDKKHTFYFAPGFPEKFKWMLNDPKMGIIAKTNQVFEKNGLKVRFEIKEPTKKQKFGDLRYSFINFIEDEDGAAPLGYGPSDANPLTGELVAANLMVWSSMLDYYVKIIHDQVKDDETRRENSTLYTRMKQRMGEKNMAQWTMTSDKIKGTSLSAKAFDFLLPQFTYNYPGWSRFTSHGHSSSDVESDEGVFSASNEIIKFNSLQDLKNLDIPLAKDQLALDRINEAHKHAEYSMNQLAQKPHATGQITMYDREAHMADVPPMVVNGMNPEQIIDIILYRVTTHEFGHNLNLRHNFYGSVDKKNFRKDMPAKDRHGQQIFKNVGGQKVPVMYESTTSSIMEYLSLKDELHVQFEWEPYDEAALVYAYSSGFKDIGKEQDKRFLYCTDEHRVLNAMCNTWDFGSTPSEVALNLIDGYDAIYKRLNYRYDRAYWNTSGYDSRVFQTMFSLKKFLMMWRTAFYDENIRNTLNKSKILTDEKDAEKISADIQNDLIQAVKLSIAFYDSVIQQSRAQRDYIGQFDKNGEVSRIGIISDKIYAAYFLMGDDRFLYNPNRFLNNASFLTYRNESMLTNLIDEVYGNLTTVRVAMEPWFIGFGRGLFALNAVNSANKGDKGLIDKIKVQCFSADSMKSNFGIDVKAYELNKGEALRPLVVALHTPTPNSVKLSYYKDSQLLGILKVGQNYFVAAQKSNAYAFNIIDNAFNSDWEFDNSLVEAKSDIMDLRNFYKVVNNDLDLTCQ